MNLSRLLLTAGGLGLLRPAPGTWGSLPPPALALALVMILGRDGWTGTDAWIVDGALAALGAIFAVACVRLGARGETIFGRKDPGSVVADEVAGAALTLIAAPWADPSLDHALLHNTLIAGSGFLLFRIFDIIKPPPARAWQRFEGGWGILVDDLIAGLYALIVLQVGARVLA